MLEPVELRMHRDHDTVIRARGSLVPLKRPIINKNFGVVMETNGPAMDPSTNNSLQDVYHLSQSIPSKSY